MEYSEFIDLIQGHFTDFALYYAVGFAVALPFIIFYRRYAIPLILYCVEYTVYCTVFHVVIHGFVFLVVWFKGETTMHYIKDETDLVDWSTPFYDFWNRAAYSPFWLFYLELVLLIIILGLMIKFRPYHPAKIKKKDPPKSMSGTMGQSSFGGRGAGGSSF